MEDAGGRSITSYQLSEKKFEPKGIKCRNCGSTKTISHTDADLRRDRLLIWQCFDCDEFFQTGWDIDS